MMKLSHVCALSAVTESDNYLSQIFCRDFSRFFVPRFFSSTSCLYRSLPLFDPLTSLLSIYLPLSFSFARAQGQLSREYPRLTPLRLLLAEAADDDLFGDVALAHIDELSAAVRRIETRLTEAVALLSAPPRELKEISAAYVYFYHQLSYICCFIVSFILIYLLV